MAAAAAYAVEHEVDDELMLSFGRLIRTARDDAEWFANVKWFLEKAEANPNKVRGIYAEDGQSPVLRNPILAAMEWNMLVKPHGYVEVNDDDEEYDKACLAMRFVKCLLTSMGGPTVLA